MPKGLNPFKETRRGIIFDCLRRFPNHGIHTISKKIYKENPELFTDYEHCRSVVRYYCGKNGDENRRDLKVKDYVRE